MRSLLHLLLIPAIVVTIGATTTADEKAANEKTSNAATANSETPNAEKPNADWPQLLGPRRNGIYRGPPIAASWPKSGPKVLWKRSIGDGYAAPVIANGKLVLFHRLGDQERIDCFDAKTGKPIWTKSYPTAYHDSFRYDDGPRGTPTISGGRVYCFGAIGTLTCLDFAKGDILWQQQTHQMYRPTDSYFGAACSPLVDDGKVYINVGGKKTIPDASGKSPRGTGIVAFDAETGKVRWTSLRDDASYSSPVVTTFDGARRLVFFTRTYVAVLDPTDGAVLFQKRWRPRINASVNAATPLVIGDHIFVSTSYSTGGLLLRRTGKDKFEEVWSGEGILSSHYSTSLHHDGHLFGFHGRQEASTPLRCVDLASGKVVWAQDRPGKERFGTGTLIIAGDKLVVLTDAGELVLADASTKRFRALASAKILDEGIRPHGALADGRFYARDKTQLVCVELNPAPAD